MGHSGTRIPGRKRRGRIIAGIGVSAVVAGLAAGGLGFAPQQGERAQAAAGDSGSVTRSSGVVDPDSGNWLGSFGAGPSGNDYRVWCVQPNQPDIPSAGAKEPYTSAGLKDASYFNAQDRGHGDYGYEVSDEQVLRANYLLWKYSSPVLSQIDGAAMELFVWRMLAPNELVYKAKSSNDTTYSGNDADMALRGLASRAGANSLAVIDRYNALLEESQEALSHVAPADKTAGSMSLTPREGSFSSATLHVELTAAYAGSTVPVTLGNAVFDSNGNGLADAGEKSATVVKPGDYMIAVTQPGEGQEITASAGDVTSAQTFFTPQVEVLDVTVRGNNATSQDMGKWVAPVSITGPVNAAAAITMPRYISPIVVTQVPESAQYVNSGEALQDTWTVQLQEGETWAATADVVLSGTVYGPFDEAPTAGEVPADAPVFDQLTGVRAAATATGSQPVTVTTKPVTELGYYVFVAKFTAADQDPSVRSSMKAGYTYQDTFGLPEETSLRLADVRSQAQETAYLFGTATDTAIITGHIPTGAEVGFQLYDNHGTPGDTSDDTLLGTAPSIPVDPGKYTNLAVTSEPVAVGNPFAGMSGEQAGAYDENHSLYWVESLSVNGTVEYQGAREVANETTQVPHVAVTSKAQAVVPVFGYATDTAIVDGYIPSGARVVFTAFSNAGTPGDTSDDTPVADPVEVVIHQGDAPVQMSAQEFTSPQVKFPTVGVSYWIEQLYFGDNLVHSGQPELPNETTTVEAPKSVTQAQTDAAMLDGITDTAMISGLIDEGTTLKFEAYQEAVAGSQKLSVTGELLWNTDGSPAVWTEQELASFPEENRCEMQKIGETEPVAVPAGRHDQLTITSAPLRTELAGKVFWVETLTHRDGDVIHRGECGIETETTMVHPLVLTSEATDTVKLGQKARDVAIIDGMVPEGSSVTFTAYFIPEGYDQTVNEPKTQTDVEATAVPAATDAAVAEQSAQDAPVQQEPAPVAQLSEAEVAAAAAPAEAGAAVLSELEATVDPRDSVAACVDAEAVFTTQEEPVAVRAGQNDAQRYESAQFRPSKEGTYFWVAEIRGPQGQLLARGACGEAGETTIVSEEPLASTGAAAFGVIAGTVTVLLLGGAVLLLLRRKRGAHAA